MEEEERMEEAEMTERRENEMEALKSIFNTDLVDLRESDVWRTERPPDMHIHLLPTNSSRGPRDAQSSFLDIRLKMTNLYPKMVPEISVANSKGLSQAQIDKLLEHLNSYAELHKGEEMLFELCMETQAFLAAHGSNKIFSSFHEEMEDRRRTEEHKRSEGHDRLASIDRQAMAEEVILRQREIEEEEQRVKEEAKLKPIFKPEPAEEQSSPAASARDTSAARPNKEDSKRISESVEEICDGTERIEFNTKGSSLEVVRGCQIGTKRLGGATFTGLILETGQMVAVHRWYLTPGFMQRTRKVKFLDSDSELVKQINSLENEVTGLHQRVRHRNLVRYLGFEKEELAKSKKVVVNVIQEFCRGGTLGSFIRGEQRIDLHHFRSITMQLLWALEHLHGLDVIHRNLSHACVFLLPDGTVKVGDASLDLKVREMVAAANGVLLEDVYPPSLGRGGKKCDIYRLGLVLISVLEGSIVKDQCPSIPAGLPDSLQDFLRKCLMRDERSRWSADQLNEHTFIKDSIGQIPGILANEDTSLCDESRCESPEMDEVVDGKVVAAVVEPTIINSSKQSRLNQDFTIISWIGRGGFGDVIQVKNKLDDRNYAIKRIRLNPADRQTNKKIMREVKLLSRLNHENVVRYYNTWQEVSLVSAESGQEESDATTTEVTDSQSSRVGNNSLSLLGFQIQAPSFRSPGPGEESEWSVSFMPPDSDSDSDSESESGEEVAQFSQDSESEGIVFGSSQSGKGDRDEASNAGEQPKLVERSVQLNTLYIQMEYCEKKTLRNYIDEGLYKDSKRVWTMFREIIDGLVHIHTQGMIHRDLKPANIFIDSQGHIKIGDFGLATSELLGTAAEQHHLDQRKDDIETSVSVEEDLTGLVGTALYTAPEVLKRNCAYNQKVDLYSLGVIFFEMCHRPLNTGMERIQVLTALRLPEIKIPEDSELGSQQTYIVTWLLDHDPLKRPTSHELLMSDYLPPPHVEESRIEETVRIAMKNKKSKAYRNLIKTCMTQPMPVAKDVLFDTDTVKQSAVRKLGAAYSFFRSSTEQVFCRHGAVPLDSNLFLPVGKEFYPWRHMEAVVQIMTRSGDVVSLPHDLRIPFARYLARLKLTNFKRYSFGKVVKEKKIIGVHPKELTECGFDIVSGPSGQVLADAELLVVCQELILSLGDWGDTKFILRLGHGHLLKGVLLHLSIPSNYHSQVVDIMKSFTGSSRTETTGRLQSLGVTDQGVVFLLNLLESDTGLAQLTGTLRPVTSRRGEPAQLVKSALSELKNIHTAAVRLGLQLETQFSVKNLYPPDLYSGMVLQLIRLLPRKTSHAMDIVGAGGRYNNLVATFRNNVFAHLDPAQEKEEEICATGLSLSVDRLVAAIGKRGSFNPALSQVVVAGDASEQAHICSELWRNGVRTSISATERMDELTELAKDVGAEIVIFATQEHARVSYSDKEGRFLAEKKIPLSEVVNLVIRDLKVCLDGESGSCNIPSSNNKARDEKLSSGPLPLVDYNFDFLDRDKYSLSKKKLEVRKSEKLSSALARFDSSCEVVVLALGLPGPVLRSMAAALELEDEDRFKASLSELVKLYPRYRKYLGDVCQKISTARFGGKGVPSFVLFSLDDNTFRILH